MTLPRHMQQNTREEILSADLTRIGALAGKAVMDALLQIEAGFSGTTPRNATLRGLDASFGVGLSVDITAGELVQFDVSATGDNSQYKLGALAALLTNVAMDAADPTNPRVDLIHATISSDEIDSGTRNQITLPSRVVTPVSFFKTVIPKITLAVEKGTPGASPALPVAPAGKIPLWYVHVGAAAVSLVDADLMDARVQLNPSALSRKHSREEGLFGIAELPALTNVRILSGHGFVDGAAVDNKQDQSFPRADVLPTGSGAFGDDEEYSVYLVAKGNGSAVGKTITDGIIPVLVLGVAPDSEGRPSTPITYRPLFGTGVDAVVTTTSQALYVGTIRTELGGLFQQSGDGYPVNRDGTITSILASNGTLGGESGWIRRPKFEFSTANSVRIGRGTPVISGVPGLLRPLTVNMPGNLLGATVGGSGAEVEQASTFYYAYIRNRVTAATGLTERGVVRSYVAVLSSQAPTTLLDIPDPEVGFVSGDYLYVGSVFNGSGSSFLEFFREGHHVLWQSIGQTLHSGVVAESPSFTSVTALLPDSSRMPLLAVIATLTPVAGTEASNDLFIANQTGVGIFTAQIRLTAGGAGMPALKVEKHLALAVRTDAVKAFEVQRSAIGGGGAFTLTIEQRGYIEDGESIP